MPSWWTESVVRSTVPRSHGLVTGRATSSAAVEASGKVNTGFAGLPQTPTRPVKWDLSEGSRQQPTGSLLEVIHVVLFYN